MMMRRVCFEWHDSNLTSLVRTGVKRDGLNLLSELNLSSELGEEGRRGSTEERSEEGEEN